MRARKTQGLRVITTGLFAWVVLLACTSETPRVLDTEQALTEEAQPEEPTVRTLTPRQFRFAIRDIFDFTEPLSGILPAENAQLQGLQTLEANHFENALAVTSPTPAKLDVFHRVSGAVSRHIAQNLGLYSPCKNGTDRACLDAFTIQVAERAWRRVLTSDEKSLLTEMTNEGIDTYGEETGLAVALEFLLLSPDFLYLPESPSDHTGFRTGADQAAYMAAFLWGSIPDDTLRTTAAQGELESPADLEAEAWRMVADWRVQRGANDFYRQLFEWDSIGTTSVDLETYLQGIKTTEILTETEVSATHLHKKLHPVMRMEPEALLNDVLFGSGQGTLADFLTTDTTWGSPETRELYQATTLPSAGIFFWFSEGLNSLYPLVQLQWEAEKRAGLLTTLGFLASHASATHPSPVKRGVFVLEKLLCRDIEGPLNMLPALREVGSAGGPKTNRERIEEQTSSPACASCHQQIDGIGFTFEHYDSLGAWRDFDHGEPVDASGSITLDGELHSVANAVELMHLLASSREVHDCHVKHWVHYALGREIRPSEEQEVAGLQDGFWAAKGDIRALLVNIVLSDLFRRKEGTP